MRLYALALALAATSTVRAQSEDLTGVPVRSATPDQVLNHPQGLYSGRTPLILWDSGTVAEAGGQLAGPGADAFGVIRVIGDDVIPADPPGSGGGFLVSGVRFGWWVASDNTRTTADFRITLYPSFSEGGSPVYGGTPLDQIVVRVTGLTVGGGVFQTYIDVDGTSVLPPFSSAFAYLDVVDDATLASPTVVPGINFMRRSNGVMPYGGGNPKGYFSTNGSTVMNATDFSPSNPTYPANWRAAFLSLRVDYPPASCELADTNCDGSLNGFDVEAAEQAVNGDYSSFCLDNADLNRDGAENGFDIEYAEFLVLSC